MKTYQHISMALAALAILVVSGCAIGPDYQRPALAMPAAYMHDRADVEMSKTAGLAAIPAQWWELYNDAILNQLIAVLFTAALGGGVTFVLLKLVDATIGLRVSQEDEDAGLDTTQHGESAYND